MSIDIEGRLKDADDAWKEAEVKEQGEYDAIPDGQYQARVLRFDFHDSKNGELLLRTEFEILGPEQFGRKTSIFSNLERPDLMGYTKSHLAMLGIEDIDPLTTLEARLKEALDVVCDIGVKTVTKGENKYTNTYLNRVLKDVKMEDVDRKEPPEDDSSIPF